MRSIVVGTDFSSGSIVALELAIDIANKMECGVKLVWARREKILASEDQQVAMLHTAEEKLREMCEKYQPRMTSGLLRWEICSGKVSSVISRMARHNNAPLIVIGTNGASGFEKYWMGSTAVRIVQESPVPVLTIREGFNFHKNLERIVVPIRTNINSRQKVPAAVSMAKLFSAQIHVLGLYDSTDQMSQLKAYVNQTTEILKKDGIAHEVAMRKYDNYCDTLLDYAREVNTDLIVINTEQDRLVSQLFLGTNAQQIVHNSQRPVLCVHPADIFFFSKT
ncbi:MAG: universal stress protein [Bacteroidales bacterium]|nr:universal stress protein [Candidatus Colimorpha merdihippi]